MIYVCLDSCIFDRIITQGQPGSTVECFEELKKLAQEGKVRVIAPEVVLLEFEKFCRELDNQFAASIEQFRKDIAETCAKKQKQWNEIDDLKQSLAPHIEAEAAKKKAAFPDRIKAVRDWLQSEAVVLVPYDSEIMLKAKRRLMSGRMPPSDKKADQDASIIESVLKVLPKGEELYFCSENIKDFALEIPNKGLALHPLLEGDLPKTRFFANLCSLVEAVKSGKAPPQPTEKELEKAVEAAVVTTRAERLAGCDLSAKARTLLAEGSKDRQGLILCVRTTGGLTLQANGQNLAQPRDPRSDAMWMQAVQELVEGGLLAARGDRGEVFALTGRGYQVADVLTHPIKVMFLPRNHGAATEELGSALFYAVPLENPKDFRCTPEFLIEFDDAKRIASDLSFGRVIGEVSEYEWRQD